MTLCQVRPAYCRALSQFQKVLTQRAALLRRIRDGEESPHALGYWDEQLARLAAPILRERAAFVAQAGAGAARVYAALAHAEEADEADEEGIDGAEGAGTDAGAEGDAQGALRLVYRPAYEGPLDGDDEQAAAGIRPRLGHLGRRRIGPGGDEVGTPPEDRAVLSGAVEPSTKHL